MNIEDECYAIVDEYGNRKGGYNNNFKLFDTFVGAERQLPRLQRIEDNRTDSSVCELEIVKLKFEVVI